MTTFARISIPAPFHKSTRTKLFPLALVVGVMLGAIAFPCQAATPNQVLVIINNSSPTSRAIGMQYAQKRGVTDVLRVQCIDSSRSQDNETIGFAEYQQQIETPIRAYLQTHTQINFIVTTRGVPIRVSGGQTGEAFSGTTETSLDSTLAALDYDKLAGAELITFNDPAGFAVGTAWKNRYWNANEPFTHAKFGGYLVTRLDGYTLPDAEALTTHSLAAEKGLKPGKFLLDVQPDFVINDPNEQPRPLPSPIITEESAFADFNADMVKAGQNLMTRGFSVDLDLNEAFVGNQTNLLSYWSWGSNDPFFNQAAYNSLKFTPGAIGDTAVSTSARSFFPQSFGQSMIADLIHQGITGVKGYTDEPLLQAISSPSIALDRYTRGFTLAESFYAASNFVGWTDVVVGDALSHPYPSQPATTSHK
ncbi:TIGR03790 family protein [Terriglobus saanensis]|uniref:TIGR03790 family protein n=1 Tax=Terriglobus saanensis (strain ATCC BAA-1853 / DSM 23119 / SP1PR4) TaxID=401053 RepID=E8V6T4_TERSS|nr:TIGR03790 family protein [Terriglobus saanensis]ADV83886.1 hypothetical protein AciPR4_3128 [Terriglobus saanensis SP1PR4]